MTAIDVIVLLIVAFFVGALGEMIGGVKAPGGWVGSTIVGFIGAWIGGLLLHFGPFIRGIQVFPAIIGAAAFILGLRIILSTTRHI